MKTTFFLDLVVLSLLGSSTLIGQGLSMFQLSNAPHTGVDAPVFDAEGTPLGPDYSVELWGGLMPDSLVPAYRREGDRLLLPFAGSGYFASGEEMIVPSDHNGGYSWLQVLAWDSRLGATYEDVKALNIGGYGESELFFALGSDPFQSLPNVPGPLIGLESFSLRPVVPEPGTWALLALGGLALFWAGRRWGRRGQQANARNC